MLSSPPSEGKLIWDVILQQPGATTTSSTPCPEEHPAPWNVVPLIPPQGQCDPTWLHGTGVLSPPQHPVSAPLAMLTAVTFPSVATPAVLQVFSRVFEARCKPQGSSVGFE